MEEFQILIVDDEPEQLKILTSHLMESHPEYRLMLATNGKDAVEIAGALKPALILMDWQMPVMNGIEAIRVLKSSSQTNSISIIVITGIFDDAEKLSEALSAGAIDFISKPYDRAILNARVEAQLKNITIFREHLENKCRIADQEKALFMKEKELLEKELKYHRKQLTMNTVNLLKLGNLIQNVTGEIESLRKYTIGKGELIIKSLISSLNDRSSERMWSEFEYYFEKVNPDFYKKLTKKIPDITTREKRLCAFLKMNMTSKEISSVTLKSQNAIDVAKHRLRKKGGFHFESDLDGFILSL